MNHIFYQTKTYFSNTGDVLINRALIGELRQFGQIHANCSAGIPQEFIRGLGIEKDECMYSKSELSFVKSVVSCAWESKKKGDRVYVFSGLGDMYGGSVKLAARNFLSGLIFPLFRLFGVRIVRIGRSMGPITDLMALTERIRSKNLTYNYVRDSRSLERCKAIGIKNAAYCPDMAWLFNKEHGRTINQTGMVLVNLRNSIFDDVEDAFVQSTLRQCGEVLTALAAHLGPEMKVCVAYQIAEDEAFSKKVYEYLKDRFNVVRIDHQLTLEEFDEVYGSVDYHVSNRMHSLLAGYKYGSLPIAMIDVAIHTKISATLQDCGLEELMIDLNAGSTNGQVTHMVKNREELLNRIWDCEARCVAQIIQTLEHIFAN